MPNRQTPKPFNEIAKTFPPMLPEDTYRKRQWDFFSKVVMPKIPENYSILATWNYFKALTKRAPLLTPGQRVEATISLGATAALKQAIKPLAGLGIGKGVYDNLNNKENKLLQLAEREGLHYEAASGIGGFVGATVPLALAWEAAGPLVGAELEPAAEAAGERIGLMNRMARGSLSFGTVQAAQEMHGGRFIAGMKGAAVGAAWELALAPFSYLGKRGTKAAERAMEDAAQAKPMDPAADAATSQEISRTVDEARKQGVPNSGTVVTNSVRGLNVVMRPKEGAPITLNVRPGQEGRILDQMKSIIDAGGGLDHFEVNPDDASFHNKFMKMLALRQGSNEYDKLNVVRTRTGQEESIATQLTKEGIPATQAASGKVQIHAQRVELPETPKPAEAAPTGPTPEELDTAIDQVKFPASMRGPAKSGITPQMFLRAQVEKLYDENIPEGAKGGARAVVNKLAPELLPENWEITRQAILHEPGEEVPEPPEEPSAFEQEMQGVSKLVPLRPDYEMREPETGALKPGFQVRPHPGVRIPTTESIPADESTQSVLQQLGRVRGGVRKLLAPSVVRALFPESADVYGIAHPDINELLEQAGRSERTVGGPGFIVDTLDRDTMYHEGLHALGFATDTDPNRFIDNLAYPDRKTAQDLGNALQKNHPSVYGEMNRPELMDEAFTHAATAVRMNDLHTLDVLGQWDSGIRGVQDFVNETAKRIEDGLLEKPESVAQRVLQSRMHDLVRRTDTNVVYHYNQYLADGKVFWSGEHHAWTFVDRTGNMKHFPDPMDLMDFLEEQDATDRAPAATTSLGLKGVRGGLVPPDSVSANDDLPMPDAPPDKKLGGFGLTPLTSLFRPFIPWVATVDEKLNKIFALRGQRLPIYDAVRDVDDAVHAGTSWTVEHWKQAADVLGGLDSKKQYDVFQYLTYEPKDRPSVVNQLKLSPTEVHKAEQIDAFVKDLDHDTHLPLVRYLRDVYPRLRSFGFQYDPVFGPFKRASEADFWEKSIRYDMSFDPKDAHIGRFIDFALRAGHEKKFTGAPLAELNRLVNLKGREGGYVLGPFRWPLENYVKYVKGIPDVSQQMLNRVIGDFGERLNARIRAINTHLPEGMRMSEVTTYPKALMNKFLVLSYTAGLGARAAIPIRDSLQAFMLGLPLLGPTDFARGFARAMTDEGYAHALDSGALLQGREIGALYGDIISEIPQGGTGIMDRLQRFSNKILAPSRWGHNVGRNIIFNGEYLRALDAVRDFRAGDASIDDVIKRTSLWFNDGPEQIRIMRSLKDPEVAPQDVAKQMALNAVDLTQWAYRRGAQPTLLRTGLGRIFGQYGMWPLSYMDFLGRVAKKTALYPAQGLKLAGMFAAVNYAAIEAMERGLGADVGKWFMFSPAGYAGSPHLEFVQNLFKAPEDSTEGEQARRQIMQYPMNFVPGAVELQSILKAINANPSIYEHGLLSPSLLQVLGFQPLKSIEAQEDYKQWLRQQLGYSKGQP